MLKYIFNISFCLLAFFQVNGQGDKYVPSALRLSAEVANFGYSLLKDNYDTWEFEADVDFDRYFLVVDYGYARYSLNEPYFQYEGEGNYFRVGPDVNFIKSRRLLNFLAFGFRYAHSNFREDLTYSTYNSLEPETSWPEESLSYSESGIKGRWFEMNTSLKANIFNNFYMGFTVRYKLLPSSIKTGTFSTYYIPGFGKWVNNSNWGLSYYVSYRIPFRKKKQVNILDQIGN